MKCAAHFPIMGDMYRQFMPIFHTGQEFRGSTILTKLMEKVKPIAPPTLLFWPQWDEWMMSQHTLNIFIVYVLTAGICLSYSRQGRMIICVLIVV